MVTTLQTGTKYDFSPEVVTQVSSFLQDTVRYSSLAMQRIPVEVSLNPLQQKYEWQKKDYDVGVGFEIDIANGIDAAFNEEYKSEDTPLIFGNYALSYDRLRRIQGSRYGLQERLQDHMGILARRADLITYMGDSKYSIDALGSATPGTEITTQLNVSSVANISSTFSAAFKQLRSALKYSGIFISPQSTVNVEMTPDIYQTAEAALSTDQDFNGLQFLQRMLTSTFGSASRVYENHYLGGSYSTNAAGVSTITEGTDKVLIYVSDPRIMKIVQSPMEIRQSPLDQTKGQTFQPIFRHTRIDVEPLGVLVETDVAVA